MGRKTEQTFRIVHRYLGFFLAGIMVVYAISGIVLTFRNTDYLKKEIQIDKDLGPNIAADDLGRALGNGRFSVDNDEGGITYFEGGTYNQKTGLASYTEKKLPLLLENMNNIHKMHSGQPLFWLGIFFWNPYCSLRYPPFGSLGPLLPYSKKDFTLPGVASF